MIKKLLVVGDVHIKPDISNERLTKLGRLVVDLKPDVIVQIGDMADMPSLSMFDVGKKSFEGKRYSKDIAAVHDGLKKFQSPIDEYNKELATKKLKKYNPKKYICMGNHERRIERAVNSDPKLDGTMGLEDLQYEEFGWETVPFLEPLVIEGVVFQHYYTSGAFERAMSGENLGNGILKKYHTSAFAGHNHLLQLAWQSDANGKRLMAGSIGCYFDHEEEYFSRQTQNNFWRGVILLRGVDNGSIEDYETISLSRIKREY